MALTLQRNDSPAKPGGLLLWISSSDIPTFFNPYQTLLWHANLNPTTELRESDDHFFHFCQSHRGLKPFFHKILLFVSWVSFLDAHQTML